MVGKCGCGSDFLPPALLRLRLDTDIRMSGLPWFEPGRWGSSEPLKLTF
jgi:hypothetical protein